MLPPPLYSYNSSRHTATLHLPLCKARNIVQDVLRNQPILGQPTAVLSCQSQQPTHAQHFASCRLNVQGIQVQATRAQRFTQNVGSTCQA